MKRDVEEKFFEDEMVAESFGVNEAVLREDWKLLRKLSLNPGGFGKDRASAWCVDLKFQYVAYE